jgi:hypothetical protein
VIALFVTVAAVFTVYLVLFPTAGLSVYAAYGVLLVVLAVAREHFGASLVQFAILGVTVLLADFSIGRLGLSWWPFATLFAAVCALAFRLLQRLAGGRTALVQSVLATLLMLVLEARYLLDPAYEPTLDRSLTLVAAVGFAGAWSLGWAIPPAVRLWRRSRSRGARRVGRGGRGAQRNGRVVRAARR